MTQDRAVLRRVAVDLAGDHDAPGAGGGDLDRSSVADGQAAQPVDLGMAGLVAGVDDEAGPEAAHVDAAAGRAACNERRAEVVRSIRGKAS